MRLAFLIASVSAAILAYEVALMRALSVARGHHFAYMVVSMALLGFGASGTLLSLVGERLRRRFEASMTLFAAAFAVAVPASFALAQQVPFDIFQLAWDRTQYLYLGESFLACFVPFFLGATCIGLALTHDARRVHGLYFWNLLGSGAGSAGIVAAMFVLPPAKLPLAAFAVAGLGTVVYAARRRRWVLGVAGALAVAAAFFTVVSPLELRLSQYKALVAFRNMGARVVERRSGPLGMVHVLDGPMIRLVPGLSLAWQEDQPRQRALVVDADSASAIYHLDDPKQAEVFDYTTSALPYHLLDKPKTLIIGAGGGGDVLLARYHGCRDITALELDPTIADLMRGSQAEFAGHLYSQPGVRLVVAEARGFLARTPEKFDLIELPLVDSFGAAGAGVAALNESYLYTVEAFRAYLDHLTPNGILCVTRWLKNPVSDSDFIRIVSTLTEAMSPFGIYWSNPDIIAIRGMFTATVLASHRPFSRKQFAATRDFCRERCFDLIYYDCIWLNTPDDRPSDVPKGVNDYNLIQEPRYYMDAAIKLLSGERDHFIRSYPFDISPTTDDRPYHSLTQRWRGIRFLREKLGDQWVRYADWGYIVLWATLAQAVVLGAALILLPLVVGRRRMARRQGRGSGVEGRGAGVEGRVEEAAGPSHTARGTRPASRVTHHASRGTRHGSLATFIYFACLGVAYMFIEIVMMQKLSLFLASPIYSAAIVLSAFMVFSGLGSLAAGRMRVGASAAATRGVAGIVVAGAAVWLGMDWCLGALAGGGFWLRGAAAAGLAGSLAFFMGMPFPSGLRLVAAGSPALASWAWGVNGAASVVGAVLAMVLAVEWGFGAVFLLALALYVVARVALRGMAQQGGEGT